LLDQNKWCEARRIPSEHALVWIPGHDDGDSEMIVIAVPR
jgi:hypothetical protein